MKEILTINPFKPRRKRRKATKGSIMPKRRRRRTRKAAATRAIVRRSASPRRNPTRFRRRARAAAQRAGGVIRNLQIMQSTIDAAKQIGGMMAAQFFAKKFADNGGANDPGWTWKNYLWAMVGAFSSGIAAEMIKRGSGKEFLKGGLSLIGYKLITNELSQKSEFVAQYFGADNGVFLGTDGQYYSPGDTYLGQDGEVYLMGQDGVWRPTSDGYRLSGSVEPPSSLGGPMVQQGALGGKEAYERAYSAGTPVWG